MDVQSVTPDRLQEMLDGDRAALNRLIQALAPHVRLRIASICRGRVRGERAASAPDLDDLCQEALLELFGNGARALRVWHPERGLRLTSFAQLVAERVALTRLRGWARGDAPARALDSLGEERAFPGEERAVDSGQRPDRRLAARARLEVVTARLEKELSPRGLAIFRALIVEQRTVHAMHTEFALSANAVHAWRSRLLKRVQVILDDLEPSSARSPK